MGTVKSPSIGSKVIKETVKFPGVGTNTAMGTLNFPSNTIVVKCHDEEKELRSITDGDSFKKYFSAKSGESLKSILQKYKQTTFDRVFNSIAPDQLDELAAKASVNSHLNPFPNTYKAPNFHNFLRIECSSDMPILTLVNLLNS